MNKSKIFLTLGVWVAILPYLGFPFVFKNILFTLTGLIIIYLAYIIYHETKVCDSKNNKIDSFSENNKFNSKEEVIQRKVEEIEIFSEEVN